MSRDSTLFVSIASYRDSRCEKTVEHAFQHAQYPKRVFLGICQQNKSGDADCVPRSFDWEKNIRIKRIDYTEARGPTYARYLCTQMYKNEDFFFQIDSHCLFVKHWDTHLIDMLCDIEKRENISKVILSHYPPEYEKYTENPKPSDPVTHITQCRFDENGILTFAGAVYKRPGRYPQKNPFVAAGFIFSRGHLLQDVPFDPHLPYLFTGEEMLLSVRFFTSGWDVYTPNRNIIYHAYTRAHEPKFWDDHVYSPHRVFEKIKVLTGLRPVEHMPSEFVQDMKTYGLGSQRTLKEYYDLIGVDPVKKKVIKKPSIEFYCCPSLQQQDDTPKTWVVLVLLSLLVIFFLVFFCVIWSVTRNQSKKKKEK
jgi:[Skp1-protein]-hydroxyproline N-acetylglucosaminyltransferase